MSDPAKKAASRAASRKIAVALRGLSYDDAVLAAVGPSARLF